MNRALIIGILGGVIVLAAVALTFFIDRPPDGAEKAETSPPVVQPAAPAASPAPKASETAPKAPESVAKAETKPAATDKPKEPTKPSFDVVRINPRGDTVLAGRAEPHAEVTIKDGEKVIGKVTADSRGEWVQVPEKALPPGTRELSLSAKSAKDKEKKPVKSDNKVVLVVPERGKDIAGRKTARESGALVIAVPRDGSSGVKVLQTPGTQAQASPPSTPQDGAKPADQEQKVAAAPEKTPATTVAKSEDPVTGTKAGAATTEAKTPEPKAVATAEVPKAAEKMAAPTAVAKAEPPAPVATAKAPEPAAKAAETMTVAEAPQAAKPDAAASPGDAAKSAAVPKSADLTKPAEVTKSVEVAKPAEVTKPADVAKPTQVARATDVAKPAAPAAGSEGTRTRGFDASADNGRSTSGATSGGDPAGAPPAAKQTDEIVVATAQPPQTTRQTEPGAEQQAAAQPRRPDASRGLAVSSAPKDRDKGPGLSASGLTLDAIDYDDTGRLALTGRAKAGANVQVYLDNRPLGAAAVGPDGRWQLEPSDTVPPGLYRMRVDQVDPKGKVLARIETRFARSEPLGDLPRDSIVFVQPGNSLWRIARRTYGEGLRYSVIYEANRAQIRDPDLIYPGQVFHLPRVN